MMNSQSLLGQAVVLEPARNADNVLQPLVDATTPLIIRAHSSTQTGALLRFEDSLGNLLSSVDANGAITGAAASPAGSVILAPATVNRNLIQPTADASLGLSVQPHSATQVYPLARVGSALTSSTNEGLVSIHTAVDAPALVLKGSASQSTDILDVLDDSENFIAGIDFAGSVGGKSFSNFRSAPNPFADPLLQITKSTTAPTAHLLNLQLTFGQPLTRVTSDGNLHLFSENSNPAHTSEVGQITAGFLDNTAAAWKGRVTLSATDSVANRPGIVIEGDGTAARIGFLGAAAVVRQTNGTAANLAAIADAPAKAFITALSTALVNLGLLNAPA